MDTLHGPGAGLQTARIGEHFATQIDPERIIEA